MKACQILGLIFVLKLKSYINLIQVYYNLYNFFKTGIKEVLIVQCVGSP